MIKIGKKLVIVALASGIALPAFAMKTTLDGSGGDFQGRANANAEARGVGGKESSGWSMPERAGKEGKSGGGKEGGGKEGGGKEGKSGGGKK